MVRPARLVLLGRQGLRGLLVRPLPLRVRLAPPARPALLAQHLLSQAPLVPRVQLARLVRPQLSQAPPAPPVQRVPLPL